MKHQCFASAREQEQPCGNCKGEWSTIVRCRLCKRPICARCRNSECPANPKLPVQRGPLDEPML